MGWKQYFWCGHRGATAGHVVAPATVAPEARPRAPAGHWNVAAGVLAVVLIGGCSSTDEFFSDQPPPPTGTASSFAARFRTLFGSSSEAEVAPVPASSDKTLENCPPVDIRRGAGTLQMTATGRDSAMAIRYQATFGRTARQCAEVDGSLSIKVGVQGRLILGPAGTPGDTTVPLRYALVKEGMEPQTLWSKLYLVPVSITPDNPNVAFTHVMEDMVVPMPAGREIDRYVIYVGFDPKGAAEEKPRKRGRGSR